MRVFQEHVKQVDRLLVSYCTMKESNSAISESILDKAVVEKKASP
jgi:hypothetical protein